MKNYLIIFSLLFSNVTAAQKEANIWYFGDGIGIDFNLSPPGPLTDGSIYTNEGSASIADTLGQLLFYTDGIKIWNKNHDTVKNGTGLYGSGTSIQAALIIKKPGSSNIYYIFNTGEVTHESIPKNPIYYSILDISGDNGLGEIILKNQILQNYSTERLAATKHKNGIDFWLASLTWDGLYMYLLSENGLILVRKTLPSGNFQGERGTLKFSNNSKYLGNATFSHDKICVAEFDNITGQISNERTISDVSSYGFEFSPNSKFIYFTQFDKPVLYQCEIKEIKNKSLNFTNCIKLDTIFGFGSIQLAANGKIYAISANGLNVIHYPNIKGLGCKYERNILAYPFRKHLGYKTIRTFVGLPNFVQSYIYQPSIVASNSCINTAICFKIKNNTADSIKWIFGNGVYKTSILDTLLFNYKSKGNYQVKAILYSDNFTDTLTKIINIYELQKLKLGNDTLLCKGELINYVLDSTQQNKIIWHDGTKNHSKTINSQSKAWVEVSNDYCSVSDTVFITFIDCGFKADSFCLPCSTVFSLKETSMDSATWDFGDLNTQVSLQNKIKHHYTNEGNYLVSVIVHKQNLRRKLEKIIQLNEVPVNYLPSDTSVCDEFYLSPQSHSPQNSYLWNTGSTNHEIKIFKKGIYILSIYIGNCISQDTIKVELTDCNCTLFIPSVFSPNNDNLNESFKPISNCLVENINLIIYNRWGEKIFIGNNNTPYWDGTYNGKTVQDGVYFYQFSIKLRNNKKLYKAGNISLLN